MTDSMQIAETILAQLGGSRFVAMTGAKQFVAMQSGLKFRIPRTKNITFVRITLEPNDLYTVEFLDAKGGEIAADCDVYASMLASIFTRETGLHTSL